MRIRLFLLLAWGLWAPWTQAQAPKQQTPLPKRDITVELRQVEEGREEGGSYRAGPGDAAPLLLAQKIQVRNGEKGVLRMNAAVPMQWVQSASSQSTAISNGGTSVSSSGGASSQALQWFDVGQSVTVIPRWPGGNRAATVELEVQQADLVTRSNADMPSQSRSQFSSTVTAPLAQWVTITATGPAQAARQGSYSSAGSGEGRRLLQIRVLVP